MSVHATLFSGQPLPLASPVEGLSNTCPVLVALLPLVLALILPACGELSLASTSEYLYYVQGTYGSLTAL